MVNYGTGGGAAFVQDLLKRIRAMMARTPLPGPGPTPSWAGRGVKTFAEPTGAQQMARRRGSMDIVPPAAAVATRPGVPSRVVRDLLRASESADSSRRPFMPQLPLPDAAGLSVAGRDSAGLLGDEIAPMGLPAEEPAEGAVDIGDSQVWEYALRNPDLLMKMETGELDILGLLKALRERQATEGQGSEGFR